MATSPSTKQQKHTVQFNAADTSGSSATAGTGSSPGAVSSSTTSTTASSSTGASPGDSGVDCGASGGGAASVDEPFVDVDTSGASSEKVRTGGGGGGVGGGGRGTDRRSCMSRSLLFVLLWAATPYHRTAAAGSLATPSPLESRTARFVAARASPASALSVKYLKASLPDLRAPRSPSRWRMPRSQAATASPRFARSLSSPCATASP